MSFLFPRWDMSVPWRVFFSILRQFIVHPTSWFEKFSRISEKNIASRNHDLPTKNRSLVNSNYTTCWYRIHTKQIRSTCFLFSLVCRLTLLIFPVSFLHTQSWWFYELTVGFSSQRVNHHHIGSLGAFLVPEPPPPIWRIMPVSKWLGSPPFISHGKVIWKGSHNPIRSPWLLTTCKSWDDPPSGWGETCHTADGEQKSGYITSWVWHLYCHYFWNGFYTSQMVTVAGILPLRFGFLGRYYMLTAQPRK